MSDFFLFLFKMKIDLLVSVKNIIYYNYLDYHLIDRKKISLRNLAQ